MKQVRDIFLLASCESDYIYMKDVVLLANQQLENRVTGEFDCVKALAALNTPKLKICLIDFSEGSTTCIAKNIHQLILRPSHNKTFKVLLVDKFNDVGSDKRIVFNPENRVIQIEKNIFESDFEYVKNIFNTLLEIPDVYISYGNDELGEARILIQLIRSSASASLPHLNFRHDGENRYKESASKFLDNFAQSSYIILIINKKYLLSEYCMAEFIASLDSSKSNEDFCRKIYPIVLASAHAYIFDPVKLVEIEAFWEDKRDLCVSAMQKSKNPALKEKLKLISRILECLPLFHSAIADMWGIKPDMQDEKGLSLLWDINEQLETNGYISFYDNSDEMQKALKLL
ncbi:MAG: hypothetical protein PHX24_06420 [Acidithiobacillus sp.]|nr:hypothetical protein [Acidithiobacillus sp.]